MDRLRSDPVEDAPRVSVIGETPATRRASPDHDDTIIEADDTIEGVVEFYGHQRNTSRAQRPMHIAAKQSNIIVGVVMARSSVCQIRRFA